MFIFTVWHWDNNSCITACHLCNMYFIAACLQLPHSYKRSTIHWILTAEADRLWMFSGALLSSILFCSVQWVRCWLIFSEWQTNWPVCHIATESHGLILYLSWKPGFKPASLLLEILKRDSFHLPEAKPTPSHLCLPLFLSLSLSLSNPPPPA